MTDVPADVVTASRRADLRDGLPLAAVVAVLTIVNLLLWLSANRIPPHWDSANHMLSAFRYHETLAPPASAPNVAS